ncbi:sterol desaturase family protein [Halomonas denitrificans]|nr:sterol desaturase family protein [Halomonas denitrificans]
MATGRAYRPEYCARYLPPGYSGLRHMLFIAVFCIGGMTAGIVMLDAVEPREWLAVPLTFLYANLAEYLGHRFVMHRRRRGLGLIHERHTVQHHRYFTAEEMDMDGLTDLRAILFPPSLLVFFFGAFALPAGLLLTWLLSANVAWLFVVTALGYYFSYEVLHLAYHLPGDSRVFRVPGLRRLQRLHRTHHDPTVMAHGNFNITWPICDWVFRTRR